LELAFSATGMCTLNKSHVFITVFSYTYPDGHKIMALVSSNWKYVNITRSPIPDY